MSQSAIHFFTGAWLTAAQQIEKGDLPGLEKALQGIDVNQPSMQGMSLLVFATVNKKYRAIASLLGASADPYYVVPELGAAFDLAARSDDQILLEVFLKAGVDPNHLMAGEPAAEGALMQDRYENLRLLFEYGADINLRYRLGNNLLWSALATEKYEAAAWLIECGADVHAKNDNGIAVAWTLQHSMLRTQTDSSTARRQQKIRALMQERGVRFPVAGPAPKKVPFD